MSNKFWLLKAEPDSRIVKGKDVKFSVDDFEQVRTSPWEGVRNYEARNLMKEMKVGERALFYHSNCKNPGIAAFAEVSKEAYPDYTAWDESHPYFDAKSDQNSPKWFMVDLTFSSRAKHFIPLTLLRHIADSDSKVPEEVAYIGEEGVKAVKNMDLITRGRLSIQRVSEEAWKAINLLAQHGGWDEAQFLKANPKPKAKAKTNSAKESKAKPTKSTDEAPASSSLEVAEAEPKSKARGRAAKSRSPKKPVYAEDIDEDEGGDDSDVYQEAGPLGDDDTASEFGDGDGDDEDYGSKKKNNKNTNKKGASNSGKKRKAKESADDSYTPRRTRSRRS